MFIFILGNTRVKEQLNILEYKSLVLEFKLGNYRLSRIIPRA